MNLQARFPGLRIAALFVVALLARPATANTFTWTQAAGGAQDWATGGNWSGGSAPSPVSGDTVDFSTVDLLANTTLNLGANRTATLWKFGDLSGSQTWTVSGNTLTLAGAEANLNLGTATTISSILAVANGTTATATGSGALTLDNAAFKVGGTAAGTTQTLDASGLGSFTYNNSSGTFSVGGQLSGNVTRTIGTLTLPGNSTITASTFGIAIVSNGGNINQPNNTNLGTLNLAGSTTLNVGSISLGTTQANGVLQYVSSTSNPTLKLRAANGTDAVSTMTIGWSAEGPNGYANASTVDLVTGITGTSTLDALVGTLTIGQYNRTTVNGSGTSSGTFTMGAGTLSATTMVLGLSSGTYNTAAVNGTFTSGAGGTIKVGTLTLADKTATTTGTATVTGTFNLNGGANVYAHTIQPGGNGTSGGTPARKFNWNDGTIHNYDAATDLTVTVGPTWTLAATGTHAFDIDSGRAGAVAAVLAGAGGTLAKAGDGTLTLSGANTYTGGTAINAGILNAGIAQNGTTSGPLGASGAIAFGGGTLQFSAASKDWDPSARIAAGTSASAVAIDTAGQNVTFGTALTSSQSGGLTKSGSGTLTLTAANTYTGKTTVSGGTLALSGSGSIASSIIDVGTGAMIDVTGIAGGYHVQTNQTLNGVGTVSGGIIMDSGSKLSPGNSPGTLTFDTSLKLSTGVGDNVFDLGTNTTPGVTYDQVVVNGGSGALDMNGVQWDSFTFNTDASFGVGVYTLFVATAPVGTFDAGSHPIGSGSLTGSLSTGAGGNDIILTVIPEPTTMQLLIFLGTALAMRRKLRQPRQRW